MKACPYTPAQMLAEIDRLPLFPAQQLVNGWHRDYGVEATREVQAELDRRRRKDRECDER
jgi:hypothetical protein